MEDDANCQEIRQEDVTKEIRRLKRIFKGLPKNKLDVVQGLIEQAARLRVLLNSLWADIQANGRTEMFTQSEKTEPYERERPSAKLFAQYDKNYQQLMKQLTDLCPETAGKSKLAEIMKNE